MENNRFLLMTANGHEQIFFFQHLKYKFLTGKFPPVSIVEKIRIIGKALKSGAQVFKITLLQGPQGKKVPLQLSPAANH